MHNLLILLKRYNHWLVFLALEVVCIVLMFRHDSYKASIGYTAANSVAATVNSYYAGIVDYLNLRSVNADLSRRNIHLQQQVTALREALDRVNQEKSANERVVMDSLQEYRLIAAQVCSSSLHRPNNYIVIDRGEADGVKPDMGVVGGGGIVGIVSAVNDHHSLVMPVINSKSNVSCRVRHSGYFGYLQWQGGSTVSAYLNDVPRYANVKVGDYVETSGYSAVFPPGIFVGRIAAAGNSTDGLSLSLKINLGTDFGRLRDVFVVVNHNKPEINSLFDKLQETEAK